jgi:DNA-binding ferritin-like protein (Dps family)
MATKSSEPIIGSLDESTQYLDYEDRKKKLPSEHRAAVDALERYLLHRGAKMSRASLLYMLDDLATLFEESASDGTSVRAIVGDDVGELAEAFLANYENDGESSAERARLIAVIGAIDQVGHHGRR